MEWIIFIIFTFVFYTGVQRDSYYDREIILCGIGSFVFSLIFQYMTNGRFSEFIEEGIKYVLLLVFLVNTKGFWKEKIRSGALLGLTFSTIETFFVLVSDASLYTLAHRFLLTTTMHMSVGVLMAYYLVKDKKVSALLVPFLIHYGYNLLVYNGNMLYLYLFIGFIKIISYKKRQNASREEYSYMIRNASMKEGKFHKRPMNYV